MLLALSSAEAKQAGHGERGATATRPHAAGPLARQQTRASALQRAYGNQAVLRALRATGSATVGILRREESGEEPAESPEAEEVEDDGEVHDGDTEVLGLSPSSNAGGADDEAEEPEAESPPEGQETELQSGGGSAPGRRRRRQRQSLRPWPGNRITRIEVNLTTQHMTLIYSNGATAEHVVSTGRGRPNTRDNPCPTGAEYNCTPPGTFNVGSLGNEETHNSRGDAMAWYVDVVVNTHPGLRNRSDIGIHNSQTADGTPRSHGCIRTGTSGTPNPDLSPNPNPGGGRPPNGWELARHINRSIIPGTTQVVMTGNAPTRPYTLGQRRRRHSR